MERKLDFEIKCKECKSTNVEVTATAEYKGSVVLVFVCSDCNNTDDYAFTYTKKDIR